MISYIKKVGIAGFFFTFLLSLCPNKISMLIDTHSHLYSEEFSSDIKEVIRRAKDSRVDKIILPDIDIGSRESMLNLANEYPNFLYPLIGLHPTSVKENFKDELKVIDDFLEKRKFFGIGETGIDLYWDSTFKKEQIEAFEHHIELSLKYELPIIIHARESLQEIFKVLEAYKGKSLVGIFHCFSGNIEDAKKIVGMGFYLGLGGVLTFKNSKMKDIISKISIDNIVLETDSPYLAPVPFRGKRNESSYIVKVAEKLAEIYNLPMEEIAKITTKNALNIFRL